MRTAAKGFLLAIALLGGLGLSSTPAQATITLTPISTGFNGLIGIDHHAPTNQVIVSVNYPSGVPHNFELVAADGTRTPFSTVSGFTNEVKIAAVRSGPCQGGFQAGELFTGTGVPGVIARISPDGAAVQNPWVTLPGEPGLMRGSLFQDRFCVVGGDLVVVTTAGNVWTVTSGGVAAQVASIGTHLEGVTTVPPDAAKYGPWAGHILAGAEAVGCIYSVAVPVDVLPTCWSLGINPEDLDLIPANENFFGVDYGSQTLWGAPPSEFSTMVGDVLVAQESPGILFHVRWDGATNAFQSTAIAQVPQWEHVTFSTAGIVEIPGVSDECPLSQGFWKNHPDDWPVDSLDLGTETYDQAELLALFTSPPKGDASLILAHQLIAARLNVANGSDPTPIAGILTDADALLGGFGGKLPYGVKPSSSTGRQMVDLADFLDEYNTRLLTPDCGNTTAALGGSDLRTRGPGEFGGGTLAFSLALALAPALFVSLPFLLRRRPS